MDLDYADRTFSSDSDAVLESPEDNVTKSDVIITIALVTAAVAFGGYHLNKYLAKRKKPHVDIVNVTDVPNN